MFKWPKTRRQTFGDMHLARRHLRRESMLIPSEITELILSTTCLVASTS